MEQQVPMPDTSRPVIISLQARYREKSKLGCMTCKARKKKCDETRPVCCDCRRFNKECVWADETMSRLEIRKLRKQVVEKVSKTRLRMRGPAKKDAMEGGTSKANTSEANTSKANTSKANTSKANTSEANTSKANTSEANTSEANAMGMSKTPAAMSVQMGPKLTNTMVHTNSVAPVAATRATGAAQAREDISQIPLLTFLRDLNLFHHDNGEHAETVVRNNQHVHEPLDEEIGFELAASPTFNVPTFIENIHLLKASPQDFTNLASSFNAAFSPRPHVHLSLLPDLDETGQFLYSYYVNTLSAKVCIAPSSQDESNSYQKVFLPLAHKDNAVLYGILAWAGFHLGGKWLQEGSKYAELAVKLLTHDGCFVKSAHIGHDRRSILNKLATILILCGAEICRGDVQYWSVYLNWGWKLLRDNGGILNFDNNKEEHWLISNFAYHDLMASSTLERGTYFPLDTYDTIFADAGGVSRGLLNPLLGVSKSLFKVIGDIHSLAYESKMSLDAYYTRERFPRNVNMTTENVAQSPDAPPTLISSESDTSEHGRNSRLLCSILERAQALQQNIERAKPEMADLMDMSDADLELQLTCFEAFQLSCSLYLRQLILKCNPSALESQIIVNDLFKCLDILLDSPMEATLVFPIFIAGIHLVVQHDREAMKGRMEKMIATYGPWNVVRVRFLVEKVWEANPSGDRVVDWHAILKTLGWDLNFA